MGKKSNFNERSNLQLCWKNGIVGSGEDITGKEIRKSGGV